VLLPGNVHRALKLTNELLEIVPTHQRALGNKVYYLQDIENASKEQKRGDDGTGTVHSDQVSLSYRNYILGIQIVVLPRNKLMLMLSVIMNAPAEF
jgi:hypothetical protein